ncbi:hypothetical protein ACF0H5_009401 [Mactra antiquata]
MPLQSFANIRHCNGREHGNIVDGLYRTFSEPLQDQRSICQRRRTRHSLNSPMEVIKIGSSPIKEEEETTVDLLRQVLDALSI